MALTKLNNQSLAAVTSAGIPIRSGSILQALNTSFNGEVSSSTTTPAATGLLQAITPTFANSKLLVQVDINGVYHNTTGGAVNLYLYKDSSPVTLVSGEAAAGKFGHTHAYNTAGQSITSCVFSKIVDAGSTSATTFQIYWARTNNTGLAYINVNGATSAITVTEIAG